MTTRAVLLVESDEPFGPALAAGLRRAGFNVVLARHSVAALSIIRGDTPVDVLVTRYLMPPHMPNGATLARIARRHHPALRVIYLVSVPAAEADIAAGPGVVLEKPLTVEKVVAACRNGGDQIVLAAAWLLAVSGISA